MPPQVTSLRMDQKFKKTPAGEIPVDWEVNRLGDLCPERPEYGANVPAIEFQAGLPRYVRITDIDSDGTLSSHDWKSIRREEAEPYLLTEGDMIFARSGATVGKTYLYRKSDGPCAFAGYTIRFRTDRGRLLPEYLFQLTHSELYYQWVKGVLRAGAQPNINGSEYSDFVFPVPPLLEQERIAEILSVADDAIEKTSAVIEKTRELKKGLMHQLFTHGIGHTRFKQTEIGKIPQEWSVRQLGEVALVQTGMAKNSRREAEGVIEVPYLRVANVQDGHVDLADLKTIRVQPEDISRYGLQMGDVLMTEGGDNDKLGRGCVWQAPVVPCIHQNHVFAVRCGAVLNPNFLASYAASPRGKNYFQKASKQTTNLASINSTQVRSLAVPIPPLPEQNEIVDHLGSIETEVRSHEQERDKLNSLKSALMSVLLTGQVRVAL